MDSIKNTLEAVIKDLERKKNESPAGDPEDLLGKIFSPQEAEHASFKSFRGGILYIGVDSTGWLYQLGMKKAALLAKIRGMTPVVNVKDIRFSLGRERTSLRGNKYGKS